ncbi:MAG TPA: fasciclin domain-containing protein [Planctomycetota bacterium]|jgi:uncharacterized surface protein with fasciclin (FAS1) repeats|nr:fasciclin domain-containing protein [Planctomycetota bacterium]
MKFICIALVALFQLPLTAQCESTCEGTVKASVQVGQDIVDTAITAGQFKTLVTAVQAAGLVDTLKGKGPFTVFAPTDAAFARLPKGTLEKLLMPESKGTLTGILTFHVVGERLSAKDVLSRSLLVSVGGQSFPVALKSDVATVAGVSIVKTDIACSNGVIHVIDAVMMPESSNIVEVAAKAGTFGTLLTAAKAAGLAGVLSEGGPFTVLAPSDEAFAKLPEGTVASLLLPENKDKLATILKYHVIAGRAFSPDVVKSTELSPLDGGKLWVTRKDGKVFVNKAQVVATDINASNGVIHVIDSVLLPK